MMRTRCSWHDLRGVCACLLGALVLSGCRAAPDQVQPPRPADRSDVEPALDEAERLAVLGRVWGFLKYHHPRISRGEVDWDQALLDAIPAVRGAARRRAFLAAIDGLIDRAGPPGPPVEA